MRKETWEFKNGKYQPKVLEEHILKEIVGRLWYQARIKVFRIRERIPGMSKQLSVPGIPDLVGWIPVGVKVNFPSQMTGSFPKEFASPLFIEVKRPGGARRLAQERFIAEASSDGCCAFFAESWGEVVQNMAKFGIVLTETD